MTETETETDPKPAADRAHRIVVGVDGSPPSVAALEWAARQAELTGSPLEVVVTWELPTSLGWATVPSDFDPVADSEAMLGPLLSRLAEEHPRAEVSWKIVEGHPATVLVEESRGADLLVIGSRGHGAIVGVLIGSTSEHCTAHAPCTVVVVRSPA